MSLTTSQIAQLLLPGVRQLTGRYESMKPQWSEIYQKQTSKMAIERTVAMRYLGQAALKAQGGQTNFDNASGQRYVYSHTHVAIGLGYSWTREAIDDNLYKSEFNPSNMGLLDSFKQMKEILAADVLNTGNVYNQAIGGDGVALFSNAHPIDQGTFANTPNTQVGLNESTLAAATNQIRRFRDNAGLLKPAQARKLVVPVELRRVAKRLMETPLRPGTADNDISAVREGNDLSNGYVVMDFLTNPLAWFIITDKGGLLYLERTPFETSMQVDFSTDNLLVKAYERYYFGYSEPRAAWGTFPLN
jgi:hypothetical protein